MIRCLARIKQSLTTYRKPLLVNFFCVLFLIAYSVLGGLVFLHFEYPYSQFMRQRDIDSRLDCVQSVMRAPNRSRDELAHLITQYCIADRKYEDERMEWNLKNAVLFGFGILTTLGYGKIEPETTNGRIFTVIYGFIGVPFTVIIFTNFGRYLQNLERFIRKRYCSPIRRKVSRSLSLGAAQNVEPEETNQISPLTLMGIVILYLAMGAALVAFINDEADFFNGIYFAFLCFTAIEYGALIPKNSAYLPLIIVYICLGLAISTIALDIGSTYVRKLYYLGRKLRNIANVKIWFGAKELRVKELITALGHNIGLEPTVLCDLDLDELVQNALYVKEGKLDRVPQTHMLMDGIWPPELVPLFLKDGNFPEYVDAEEKKASFRTRSITSSFRRKFQRKSDASESLQPPPPKKMSVRFEDTISAYDAQFEDIDDFDTSSVQHISKNTTTDLDTTSGISEPSTYSTAMQPSGEERKRSTTLRPGSYSPPPRKSSLRKGSMGSKRSWL